MENKDKKRKNTEYFIYVPDTKEKLVVTEEVYLAYYRPIWKIQNKAQNHGQCRCTKRQLWKCDGDCANCKYHTEGDIVSLDNPIDKSNPAGDTFADHIEDKNFNLDEIVGDMYLLNELMNALGELDTKMTYCQMIGLKRVEDTPKFHTAKAIALAEIFSPRAGDSEVNLSSICCGVRYPIAECNLTFV